MNRILVAWNLILTALAGWMLYLHFASQPGKSGPEEQPASSPAAAGITASAFPVAFVNTDTLLEYYTYYKEAKERLEGRKAKVENELQSRAGRLEKEAADYQQKASGMTFSQRATAEEKLMKQQEGLMRYKDEQLQRLMEDEQKLTEDLYDRITSFLKDYNKDKGFTYVLGFSRTGGILFAADSLDITEDVLTGLNKGAKK